MATNNVVNAPFPLSPTQGGLGVSNPTTHGILVAEGASAVTPIVLTSGQLLIGSTGLDPVAASLTAGTNISIVPAAGGITINATGGTGLIWNDVVATPQAGVVNNGYIISNAPLTTVDLPALAVEGSIIAVVGKGAGGWVLQAAGGQTIHFGNATSGVAGSLASTNQWDTVEVICVTANTTWSVRSAVGNLTVA